MSGSPWNLDGDPDLTTSSERATSFPLAAAGGEAPGELPSWRSIAITSAAGSRQPIMPRTCSSAASIPAAVQRCLMFPSCQRLTL